MKKVLALVLALAMVLSLAACGGSSSSSTTTSDSSAAATTDGSTSDGDTTTLNINLASEPDYLDPALNSSVDGGCLAVNSFEGLMTYSADGELVEGCAESYTVSDDGLTYTFTLREGLKWSNGEDLDASDFEYSWRRAADVSTAADYQYLYEILADGQYDESGSFIGLGDDAVVAQRRRHHPDCPAGLCLPLLPGFVRLPRLLPRL